MTFKTSTPSFLNNRSQVSYTLVASCASRNTSHLNYTKDCISTKEVKPERWETQSSPSLCCYHGSVGINGNTVTFYCRNPPLRTSKVCFCTETSINGWGLHLHFCDEYIFGKNTLFQLCSRSISMVTAMFMPSLPEAELK